MFLIVGMRIYSIDVKFLIVKFWTSDAEADTFSVSIAELPNLKL